MYDARASRSRKVEVVRGPAITARGPDSATWSGSRSTCATARCSETREAPRGSEHLRAGADIVDKFRKLTRGVMAERQQDALVGAVLGVELLADSRELIRLLQIGEPSPQREQERAEHA